MPLPSVTFRSELDPVVRKELDQFDGELTGYLLKEHDDDGQHTRITADAITVAGPVTITGGPLTIDGVPITGGDEIAAHAPTHQVGGTDLLTVTSLAGYPGGTAAFLRADGQFALPGTGLPAAHHATHEPGGTDAIVFAAGVLERGRTVPMGEWQAYSPVWTGSGTPPVAGNSTLTGKYMLVGKTCFVDIHFVIGSTATFAAAGNFFLSVPVAAKAPLSVSGPLLPTWGYTGARSWPFTGLFQTSTTLVFLVTAPGVAAWGPTTPAATAIGDYLHVSGAYEIA